MSFARFMSHTAGRVIRVAAGVALIILGVVSLPLPGIVLIVLGAVFVTVGVANVCLIAPLLHAPFSGRRLAR